VSLVAAALSAHRFNAHLARWYRLLYWSLAGLTVISVGVVLTWVPRLGESAEGISDSGTLSVSILGYALLSSAIVFVGGSWRREGVFVAMIGVGLAALLGAIVQQSGSSVPAATSEVREA